MSRRVAVGRKALFQDRRRAALAVAGVAVSLLLVLLLQGIFDGATRQVTTYLRRSPADVFVSEKDVRTMHMSVSTIDPSAIDRVALVEGVAWVEPIRFTSGSFVVAPDGSQQLSYVIGYDTASGRGGPRGFTSGHAPGAGQIALEQVAADRLHVSVGDVVRVFDSEFRVAGLFRGGTTISNSVAFITTDDFARRRGSAIAYLLVGAGRGIDAPRLAERLGAALPDETVQTRQQFVAEEASLVADMASDLMRIMATIAFLIALAVIGLTLLALTVAKQREHAVLRALGARTRRLVGVVVTQAVWSVGLAIALAVLLALGVGALVGRVSPAVDVSIELRSVARVAAAAVLAAVVGSVVPLRRIATVDPASAFRRAS